MNQIKKQRKARTTNFLGVFFQIGKPGDILMVEKKVTEITSLAAYYKRTVITEKVLIIEGAKTNEPVTKTMVKLTLI